MASVSDWVVKEYFEWQSFLVFQPCKYSIPGRPKRLDEEVDLMVYNPRVTEPRLPEHVVWTTDDLKGVAAAAVSVYGWHTERFYAATVQQLPDIARFASKESLQLVSKHLGTPNVAKILCLPQLPASEKLRQDVLTGLKEKGVDGVLLFRTILRDLVGSVDINKNYEKSDLLQIIRLMKNYDLIKTPQMELFAGRKRRPRRPPPAAPAEPPAAP